MVERICEYFDNIGSSGKKITLGLDGFVDEVWQVLENRSSRTDYKVFDKMRDFAKSVYDTGEGGYANEIIRKRRSYGGFVANTGKAVGRLGANPTLLGMFGSPLDPVFAEFNAAYPLISIASPSICQIFEFRDGKLMLPYVEESMDFSWDSLQSAMPRKDLENAFDADIVAIGYWSQLQHFDNIITELCNKLLIPGRCKRMFYDFADIRKRDKEALIHTLSLLADLDMPMSLSLNEHEAALLFSYYNNHFDWEQPKGAEQEAEEVRKKTDLDELIIHTPTFALAATSTEGTATVPQHHCQNPIITTGAGDNFNGGYLTASLASGHLTLSERLHVGNATTSFYIKNGHSPNITELKSELYLRD